MSKMKSGLISLSLVVAVVLYTVGMAENDTTKTSEPAVPKITQEYIMKELERGKSYYLVLLKKTDKKDGEKAVMDSLQMEHLKHIFSLKAQGKMAIAGPVASDANLRGICIYTVIDENEIKELVNADPFVINGYLAAEIYPWMSLAGDKLP